MQEESCLLYLQGTHEEMYLSTFLYIYVFTCDNIQHLCIVLCEFIVLRRVGDTSWRWLFVIEGVPSVILGILFLIILPVSPARAKFLNEDEREWLTSRHETEVTRVCYYCYSLLYRIFDELRLTKYF